MYSEVTCERCGKTVNLSLSRSCNICKEMVCGNCGCPVHAEPKELQPHEILEELARRGHRFGLLVLKSGKFVVVEPLIENTGPFDNITDAVDAYLKETGEQL